MAVSVSRLHKVLLVLCLLVFMLGLVVLTGWVLGAAVLKLVFLGPVAMKVNAALCLMVCGAVLARLVWPVTTPRLRHGLTFVSCLVVLFAGLTLSQDVVGWDLGIDQALLRDTDHAGRSLPGRVSPATAFCLMLIGLALAVAAQPLPRRWRLPLISGFGAAVVLVGVSSLGGHVLNRVQGVNSWNFVPMASDTGAAFVLLGSALLMLVHGEAGLKWALGRWTTVGFGLGMLFLLFVAAGSYHFTRQLQQQATEISRTQQVVQRAERLAGNPDEAALSEGYRRLAEQQKQLEAISTRTFLMLPMAGFVSLTLLLLALFFLNKAAVERGRANAELANSRAQFKAIFDHLTEGVVVIDKARREIVANPAALSRLGLIDPSLPHEAAVALLDSILPDGTVLPRTDYPSYRAMRGDFVRNFPLTIRRKDNGASVTAEFNTAPVLNPAGETVQFIISYRDVTARKQAEAAQHESEALFRVIFEATPDAIIMTDALSAVVMVNPGAERLFGYPRDAMLGLPIVALMPGLGRAEVLRERSELIADPSDPDIGKPWELEAVRRDGSEVPIEVVRSAFSTARGKFVMGVSRDIRLRREAERRTQRLTDFYSALSQTNHAVVYTQDPTRLFQEICRICVDYGHVKMAFIGLVDGDHVNTAVHAGPAEAFLSALHISLHPVDGQRRGPIATVVHEGRPYVCNDFHADPNTAPWRERASYLGTQATAAFPFRRAGTIIGILSLHVPEKNFFSPELVALLQEMTMDLSFALDNFDREAARTAAVAALEASKERYRRLVEVSPDAIYVLQGERISFANAAALALFGAHAPDDLLGRSVFELLHPDFRDMVAQRLQALQLEAPANPRVEQVYQRLDGSFVDVEVASVRLASGTESGHESLVQVVARDISERKRAEARIEYLATYDGLTALPNRNLMRDRITQAISHAKRTGRQLAVMYLDLDRFKVVNDGYGHPFGDTVLKAAAERLLTVVRTDDTVARQSGDEFLVLLADVRKFSDAYIVAQKVLDAFAQPFLLEAREVHVSVSIGVSIYPQNGEEADELISHADVAMYRSKDLGRNTYQFFTQEMSESTREHVDLETRLRAAIAQNELHLAYQPKVDLASGRIIGCEALLRWEHPELGAISPVRFIPIAEESGLIVPVGDWVLRTACQQARAWHDAGLPACVVSVNVSARQFLQQDVVAWVLATLRETGLAPTSLELELTESLIAQDTEKVIDTVIQLKAAGVQLSIDDFGTGYSSLSYLKRFRVDTLKIDQSFIRTMLKDAEDAVIPLAVISLAHSLKLKVIAEGVETAEQCAFLRQHGCDEIQGYYFSKPVPPEAFAQMLADGRHL